MARTSSIEQVSTDIEATCRKGKCWWNPFTYAAMYRDRASRLGSLKDWGTMLPKVESLCIMCSLSCTETSEMCLRVVDLCQLWTGFASGCSDGSRDSERDMDLDSPWSVDARPKMESPSAVCRPKCFPLLSSSSVGLRNGVGGCADVVYPARVVLTGRPSWRKLVRRSRDSATSRLRCCSGLGFEVWDGSFSMGGDM